MSPDLIENGGIRVTLKAHAVCGHCTEFADLQTEEITDAAEFAAMAEDHFKGKGWKFDKGKKVRCPTCASTRRAKKRR